MMQSKKSKPSYPANPSQARLELNAANSFAALGTRWQIHLPDQTVADTTAVITQIRSELNDYEQVYSRFRPTSLVGQMARQAGTYQFPDTIVPMWQLYQQLARLTNNRFTPFIGSLISAAGYDPSYSLQTKSLQPPPDWDSVRVALPSITALQPTELDFGAAGKGYAVDIVSDILTTKSISTAYINAGGDIRHQSSNLKDVMVVGLEHPFNDQQVIGTVQLHNQSICGSAGNRRKWGNFHHIIDPASLSSPHRIAATWVIANTTMLADALSTCLFLVEPTVLMPYFDFEYIRVFADQSIEYSSSDQIEIF